MSEEITADQLERAAYNDKTAGKKSCYICGDYYHPEGPDKIFESDHGKNICEFCVDQIVAYSVAQFGNKYSGHFEKSGEDYSTRFFPTRKEAKDALIKAIEKLHPGVERVEE